MDARFVSSPRFDADARVAFRNGRILDVEGGCYLPSGVTPIVQGDTISALAGAPGEPAEVDAEVSWDLGGRTVLPGLFNTHTHLQTVIPALVSRLRDVIVTKRHAAAQVEQNMADCLAVGVTHLRDTLTEGLDGNRKLAARIGRGEIPGPRLQQCVVVSQLGGAMAPKQSWREAMLYRLIGSPYPAYDDADAGTVAFAPHADGATVRAAVDRAIDERGADAIKLYDQRAKRISYAPGATLMSQPQLDAAADQARRRGVAVTMHHVSTESLRRGLKAGVSSLAHMPIDGPLDDADVDAFVKAGCIIEPTVSIAYDLCWRAISDRWADHPRMTSLDALRDDTHRQLVEQHWLAELRQTAILGFESAKAGRSKIAGLIDLAPAFHYFAGLISHGIDNARRLHRAGATFGCSNDAGAVPRTPAMIGLELELFDRFIGSGDTAARAAALRAATIDGAAALGVADRFASIASGKVADLVLLDGDPLEDLSAIGKPVAALFMNGELVVDNCGLADSREHQRPAS